MRWLLGQLVAELARRTDRQRWRGLRLLAIDHTTLVLPETVPLWRRFRSHRGKKGLGPVAVEFACLFHLVSRAPFFYTLGQAATSDHQLVKRLLPRLRKADLILIDKGYYSLKTFRAIRRRGAHFLVPAKVTHRPKVLQKLGDDDYLCRLKSRDETLVLRVIFVERKGFRRRRLVTSLLDPNAFPASEFGDLYHLRWGVETFYRDFKHTLQGTHWHCRSPHSFELELVAHLITVCLIRSVMLEAARQGEHELARLSFSRTLTQVRIYFRRLPCLPLPAWEPLLARLSGICATFLIRVKPGRCFSRDRQEIRSNARRKIRKRYRPTLPPLRPSQRQQVRGQLLLP